LPIQLSVAYENVRKLIIKLGDWNFDTFAVAEHRFKSRVGAFCKGIWEHNVQLIP